MAPPSAQDMRKKFNAMTAEDLNRSLLGLLGKLPVVQKVSWKSNPKYFSDLILGVNSLMVSPYSLIVSVLALFQADGTSKLDFNLFANNMCENAFCILLGINNKRVLGFNRFNNVFLFSSYMMILAIV